MLQPTPRSMPGPQGLDVGGILEARLRGREADNLCYPLMRSIAAPQAASLSSSRSKPRSR